MNLRLEPGLPHNYEITDDKEGQIDKSMTQPRGIKFFRTAIDPNPIESAGKNTERADPTDQRGITEISTEQQNMMKCKADGGENHGCCKIRDLVQLSEDEPAPVILFKTAVNNAIKNTKNNIRNGPGQSQARQSGSEFLFQPVKRSGEKIEIEISEKNKNQYRHSEYGTFDQVTSCFNRKCRDPGICFGGFAGRLILLFRACSASKKKDPDNRKEKLDHFTGSVNAFLQIRIQVRAEQEIAPGQNERKEKCKNNGRYSITSDKIRVHDLKVRFL